MKSCSAMTRDLTAVAAARPADLPGWVREHVAVCPRCARRLAAARLAQRLVTARAEILEPPQGFADRVTARLTGRRGAHEPVSEVWRPAWGLVPVFAAAAAALFIVYQASEGPGPAGLFPTEGLSASESLLLGSSAPDMDAVLSAILEGVAQ
jgi:hypothetical protein